VRSGGDVRCGLPKTPICFGFDNILYLLMHMSGTAQLQSNLEKNPGSTLTKNLLLIRLLNAGVHPLRQDDACRCQGYE
jgi:hypothetical protein